MFRCDQNGPPARRSEPDWRKEGAYLNGYVTDEQRSGRPIFIATLWAVASWLFFRVARSLRIDSRYARRNRQSGSDRLEKQPTDLRRNICLFRGQDTRVDAHEVLRIASNLPSSGFISVFTWPGCTLLIVIPGCQSGNYL